MVDYFKKHFCGFVILPLILIASNAVAREPREAGPFKFVIKNDSTISMVTKPPKRYINPDSTTITLSVTVQNNIKFNLDTLKLFVQVKRNKATEVIGPYLQMNPQSGEKEATFTLSKGSIKYKNMGGTEGEIKFVGLQLAESEAIKIHFPNTGPPKLERQTRWAPDLTDSLLESKGYLVLKFHRYKNLDSPVSDNMSNLQASPHQPVFISITDSVDTLARYTIMTDSVTQVLFQPQLDMAGSNMVLKSASVSTTPAGKKFLHEVFYLGTYDEGSKVSFSIYRLSPSDSTSISVTKDTTKISALDTVGVINARGKPTDSVFVHLDTTVVQMKFDTLHVAIPHDSVTSGKVGAASYFSMKHGTTESSGTQTMKREEYVAQFKKKPYRLSSAKVDSAHHSTYYWYRLSTFHLKVPRDYRFRLWAGFAYSSVTHQPFTIVPRSDTTSAILPGADYENKVNPVLFFSAYLWPHDIDANRALFSSYSWESLSSFCPWRPWQILESVSLTFGVPISSDIGKVYYFGGSIELIKGVNLTLGLRNYKVPTLNDNTLSVGKIFKTTDLPSSASGLPQTEITKWRIFYSLTVDIAVFAQAFKGVFTFP